MLSFQLNVTISAYCLLAASTIDRARPLPPAPQPYNTAKRDFLIKIQEASQAKWDAAKVFEVDAPEDGASAAQRGQLMMRG